MINTELFKATMEKIYKRLDGEKEILIQNQLPVKGVSEGEDIDNLLNKAKDTSFKLLVMGRFSSGKSAFVNVLLGEKLLPEKALPSTALITEIYYGKEKKVIMFPRAGRWQGGDAPFEIEPTLSEIAKYSTINNKVGLNSKEANRIDSCFEKMVVYWPLEMLKDGVSIVDSPGINDPYQNDYIVDEYVPKADAILFCIAAQQAYDKVDRVTLENLNKRGFKPIINTTYFDVVTEDMDEYEKQEYMDVTYNNFYSRHTSKECCHYVNSKLGLAAKQNHSHADFVESGYNELEKFLGEYLTEEKGKEKISAVTAAVDIYNQNLIKRINGSIAGLDTPQAEFDKRIAEATKQMEQAKLQSDEITREFKVEITKAKEKMKELIPSLYEKLYQEVNLDDFEPDTSFSLWKAKDSSKQIAEECQKEIELRYKGIVAEWNKEILEPHVTEVVQTIGSKMQKQFDIFAQDIQNANITISGKFDAVDTDVKAATKVSMFAYALVSGDWMTALLGGVLGAGAFGRTAVCQLAAGVILGIVMCFTPVGLAGFVLASLGSMITGMAWTASKAADTIKKNTIKTVRKQLAADKTKIIDNAAKQSAKIYDEMEKKLKEALHDDIAQLKENMEQIKKEKTENATRIKERKAELSRALDYIKETSAEMKDIRKELHI